METRIVTALASGSAAAASERIIKHLRDQLGDDQPKLVMIFASTEQPLGEMAQAMSLAFPGTTVLGSSTAGEFTEGGDAKGSVSAFALVGQFRVFAGLGPGLKADPEKAVLAALDGVPREVNGYPYRTGLLLLDPLAGNGEEATLIAASILGDDVPLAGGAAGDDLRMSSTEVACGATAATDAVVIAQIFSKSPLGLGVCHGHRPLSRELKVTKAAGNVVSELDGRPAWDVWRENTRDAASRLGLDVEAIPSSEEGSFLLRYEAGLAVGSEYKIRAPLSRSADGSINFACGIPQGAVIRITESVPAEQISSARQAASRAKARIKGPVAGAIVFDCIRRNLILGDTFATAVRGISEQLDGAPLAGFETYGEIALNAGEMSGFHNTTTVVLAFPKT